MAHYHIILLGVTGCYTVLLISADVGAVVRTLKMN